MFDSHEMYGFTKPVLDDSFVLKDTDDRQLASFSDRPSTVRGGGAQVALGLCPEGVVA